MRRMTGDCKYPHAIQGQQEPSPAGVSLDDDKQLKKHLQRATFLKSRLLRGALAIVAIILVVAIGLGVDQLSLRSEVGNQDRQHEIARCIDTIPTMELSNSTLQEIAELKKELNFLQSAEERTFLYQTWQCFNFDMNLLVWGTGRDTKWIAENNRGKTLFLEHNEHWTRVGNEQLASLQTSERDVNAEVLHVEYGKRTTVTNEHEHFDNLAEVEVSLPNEVTSTPWDFIFVDAPEGYEPDQTSRIPSIVTTRTLIHSGRTKFAESPAPHFRHMRATLVAVHDSNRHVEKTWAEAIFGQPLRCVGREQMCVYAVA